MHVCVCVCVWAYTSLSLISPRLRQIEGVCPSILTSTPFTPDSWENLHVNVCANPALCEASLSNCLLHCQPYPDLWWYFLYVCECCQCTYEKMFDWGKCWFMPSTSVWACVCGFQVRVWSCLADVHLCEAFVRVFAFGTGAMCDTYVRKRHKSESVFT